jgi:hypothetical protein
MTDREEPRESFETQFSRLAAKMLRTLERRRDWAMRRANSFSPKVLDRPMMGEEALARQRWQELQAYYDRAHDGVHLATVMVHAARERLRRIKDAETGRD